MTEMNIIIRPLRETDLAALQSILVEHVRDLHTGEIVDSEVQSIVNYMRGAPDEMGRLRRYIVACDRDDTAIGCMAISSPDEAMTNHFQDQAVGAVELLNAFVCKAYMRGNGIGTKLFHAICELARESGARHLLVNSGPRYANNWGFYDRVCDNACGIIRNKYGEGRHAKTWMKVL